MRKINYFLLFLLPLFFQACFKEDRLENRKNEIKKVLKNVEFTCDGIQSEYYFHAFLKGEELCYSSGFEDYLIYNVPSNGFATEGPSVNFSDTASFLESGSWLSFGFISSLPQFANYQDYFRLETPVSEFGTTPLELAEKYLKIGELPIRSSRVRKEDGFRLLIEIPYRLQENEIGFIPATFNTENGTQEGSHLEITELEKSEDEDYYFYDLTFEFNCKLYFQTFNLDDTFHEFFGDLTEGILVTRLAISKR